MAESLSIELGRSALLVMDYQVGIVAMHAAGSAAALERATAVMAAARRAGLPVIYIQVGFRQGYPEVSPVTRVSAPSASRGVSCWARPIPKFIRRLRRAPAT